MEELFLKLVNMSITASWMILAVILFRIILKKAPKYIRVLLWGLVALRLIFPFSLESVLSLIPSTEPLPEEFLYAAAPQINTGISAVNNALNPVIAESLTPAMAASANPTQILSCIFSRIWLLGLVIMLLYALVSWLILRRKVGPSIPVEHNVRLCDHISTPFILGIIRPQIYLPSSMDDATAAHVLAHEKAHLKRKDHWWKPLGYLLLCIYWFNPVIWAAYVLLCRDIEMACDEKVIQNLDVSAKKAYSTALLSCSVPRRMITACPLAFGEVGVKERIKSVLNYKKPAFWVIVVAVIASVVVAVCFLTDPEKDTSDQWEAECKTVLDQIQSMDVYDIRIDRQFEGEVILNETSSSRYLKYGKHRMCISSIPSEHKTSGYADAAVAVYMDLNGRHFEGYPSENGYTWEEKITPGVDYADPWLYSFDWDAQEVKAIARQVSDDEYFIRLKIFGSGNSDDISYDSYHVDFYFDTDGNFKHAVQTIAGEAELMGNTYPQTITATMYVQNTEEASVFQTIYEYGSGISKDFDLNLGTAILNRLEVGNYIPVECMYMNPLSSYYPGNLSNEYVYTVTEDGFYTDSFAFICNTNADDVEWGWKTIAESLEELKFLFDWLPADDTNLHADDLYQNIDSKTHLILCSGELYIIHGGSQKNTVESVWGIYRLEPQENVHIDGTEEPAASYMNGAVYNLYNSESGQIYDSRSGMDFLIRDAIINNNMYYGAIHFESHQILAEMIACAAEADTGSPVGYTVVDVLAVMIQAERNDSGIIPSFTEDYIFVNATITIDSYADGTLKLSEYQENDLDDLADYDLTALKQHCYDQAVKYWGMDTDLMVDSLLDTINSSPAQYSNAQPYIEAHQNEYDKLLYLGEYTLYYCFKAFLNNQASGIRAEIMAAACKEIGDTMGEDIAFEGQYLNGPTWFEAFHSNALELYESQGLDALQDSSRASWVLLNILAQTALPITTELAP